MNPLRRFRALFRKDRLDAEMTAEMQAHVDLQAERNVAAGMNPDEARYAALRQFGNVASIQEQARAGRGWTGLENVVKDIRLGGRSLAKSPGFTCTAILTLALGIGANTSMFNLLNTVLFRPLPFTESDHLDRLFRATSQNAKGDFSPADYLDLQSAMDGYGQIAAYAPADVSVAEPGEPAEMAKAARISSNFFSTLGIPPRLGRDFQAKEASLGHHRVLVISHRYWQNRLGGDERVVGRVVRVGGEAHEIVGVLPATFEDWRFQGGVDLFRPLGLTEGESTDRNSPWIKLVGRRSPAISRAQASDFMTAFGQRLATDFPAANAATTWRTVPLNDTVVNARSKVILAMLVGLSGCVLLIACSNLANLLLARTMTRAREFAVRAALGASHSRLLRPLLAESVLLAVAGGLCAILIARWTADWMSARSFGENRATIVLFLDWRVLGWAFLASLMTAVSFSLVPALFALRLDLNVTLKSGSRGTTGGRGHQRFRSFLIVGQFALAMILLAGAALFMRGVNVLSEERHGWESNQLVVGTVLLPLATYPDSAAVTAFQHAVVERLAALPGVESVSVSHAMPFLGLSATRKFLVQGREMPEPGREPAAATNGISPRYFSTVGTRVLAGRVFSETDTQASPKVFIVNQAMADGLFGEESPLGRRIALVAGETLEWGEIVGVVDNVQSVFAESNPVTYQLYQPMAQAARHHHEVAVRSAGIASSTLIAEIRATMAALDPDLPVRNLLPADQVIARANRDWGTLSSMLSSLALLGLALAGLGIYGVVARTMAQRTGEFGIRLALGARAGDIARIVLMSGVKLALAGTALGLFGAFGISRLIATGLPRMETNSVPVLLGVTLLLVAVALIACYLPARRAAKVDPMVALRAE